MSFRRYFRRAARDEESAQDIQFYLDIETEDNMARGMGLEEARAAARRKFGNTTLIHEEIVRMNSIQILETSWRDLLYAFRAARKNAALTATTVLTLALAIGGNTAMFAVIRSVLLKPLAYREPDRLVQISDGSTSVRFDEMKAEAHSYRGVGAYLRGIENIPLSGGTEPEVLKGALVSANFLNILEVEPLLGRTFRPEEDTPAGPRVTIISAELWHRRFDGAADVLGKTLTLSATSYTIVGVLPTGFQFPFASVDVWITKVSEANPDPTLSPVLALFGRLNPGVNIEQATAELAVLNQHYRSAHPGMLDGKPNTVERVTPLRDHLVATVRLMLWTLFGAVGLVLLIACANVASLLLARAASRSREFAVRAAIGASRSRLMRQLLAESLVLALAGGAMGVLLAEWSLVGIAHAAVLNLPRIGEIRPDGIVLGFAMLLSIGTALLFGMAPALGGSRPDLAAVLRASGEAASLTGKKRIALGLNARGLLVIGQVSLSMILLIGAALLTQSLARMYGVNPGFNPSQLLTMRISLPPSRYDTGRKQATFFDELARRVQSLPGVRGAAAMFTIPMSGYPMVPVQLANQPPQPLNQRRLAVLQNVTHEYFQTFGIPLRRGRDFSERDDATAPLVAIVNESLAHVLWPAYPNGLDPLGQRILIGNKNDPVEIVGIVADIHQAALEMDPLPGVFRPFDQFPLVSAGFAVRTAGDPLTFTRAVRDQVLAMDSDQPVSAIETMENLLEAQGGQRRLILILLGCFAGIALLLTVIGIYGVIAYSVAQRTQEVGIRRALGAQHMDILRLVVTQGLVLTLVGVVLGITGALALTRVMTSLLFQTSAADPVAFVGVALLFGIVALAASYIPARRAARIDPTTALRIG
jgi:putative ABC transport system permease protein